MKNYFYIIFMITTLVLLSGCGIIDNSKEEEFEKKKEEFYTKFDTVALTILARTQLANDLLDRDLYIEKDDELLDLLIEIGEIPSDFDSEGLSDEKRMEHLQMFDIAIALAQMEQLILGEFDGGLDSIDTEVVVNLMQERNLLSESDDFTAKYIEDYLSKH